MKAMKPKSSPAKKPHESSAEWAKRATETALAGGPGIVKNLPVWYLGLEEILPFALVGSNIAGEAVIEPALVEAATSPEALLKLCYFAEALEAQTGAVPENLWLWEKVGSGQAISSKAPLAYWRHHQQYVRAGCGSLDQMVAGMLAIHQPLVRGPILYEEPEDEEMIELADELRSRADAKSQLLAELMFYWRRERSAQVTDALDTLRGDVFSLLSNEDVIADLELVGTSRATRARNATTHYTLSDQNLSLDVQHARAVILANGPRFTFGSMIDFDKDTRQLQLRYDDALREDGFVPTALVSDDWVNPGKKPGVLKDVASDLLNGATVNPVTVALLESSDPQFVTPPATFDVGDISGLVSSLDNSYLAVQGPPGTGKTYQASKAIYDAVQSGKRVGICATSHAAIENLLAAVVERFVGHQGRKDLSAVKKYSGDLEDQRIINSVTYTTSNREASDEDFNVVAGTTWLFSTEEMRSNPVDYLFIDEAGQMALADALAASTAAKNVVLLGDPLQLAQVTLADHPGGAGVSVLGHILGSGTMPEGRGVFLAESRRMHPELCDFVSEYVYQSRLSSHKACKNQKIKGHGTGLRRLVAKHDGRTRSSREEVELVKRAVEGLVGTTWVGADKKSRAIEPSDILVVAPYNDQVDLLRLALSPDVEVGTVDRFQGREAPVVIYTLTTSNAAYMPRTTSFLFSKNRLNVAVSRAQGLAYVICTDSLLATRARSVEEIDLIGTMAAAVERAEVVEF